MNTLLRTSLLAGVYLLAGCGNGDRTGNSPTDQATATCPSAIKDLAFQAPIPDAEGTNELCSNGQNDFHTIDKNGNESTWFDCESNQCNHSALVDVCEALENTNEKCSDHIDNANADTSGINKNFRGKTNGLIDCADPSCFKNPNITVCAEQAPKYELGNDCHDGLDNDGDGLVDCEDPDCLHAKASCCELNGKTRVLFDNAHHQVAGAVDWIVDVTGRHPFPSRPTGENGWHGSLSSFGLDLLNSGDYIIETLPQNRTLTFGSNAIQDLSNYQIAVIVEPSSSFSETEVKALYDFLMNGGRLLLVADHAGADRDGNGVDAVIALNDFIARVPGAAAKETSPLGFYVNDGSFSANSTTKPAAGAENHPVISGKFGTVNSTGLYGAADFTITDQDKVKALLTEKNSDLPFAIAAQYGSGRLVAIGDSAIVGDGTNYLGLTMTTENGYSDRSLQNREFLLNAMEWLRAR